MPRHQILPSTATPEALAQLIQRNKIETRIHTERIDLDETEIKELEHKSSVAGRQMDKLKDELKTITELFKNGTVDPYPFTIHPSKGIKILDENRKYADRCVVLGYTEEEITLYGLPWSERDVIVFVNIEGTEFPQYQEKMSLEQKNAWGNSLFQEEESLQKELSKSQRQKKNKNLDSGPADIAKKFHDDLAKGGMKVVGVKDNEMTIETDLPPSDIGGDKDLINPFA